MTPPLTLERWLDLATHGLAPEAASRVRREYADAFHDAHDAGERDVVAGWGDPHRVNRELRPVHLTGRETRALHPGYAPTWAGLRRALGEDLFLFGLVVGDALWDTWQGATVPWGRFALLLSGLLMLTLARWLSVSRLDAGRWRALSYWALQAKTGLLLYWLWGLWELRTVWKNFRLPAELSADVLLPLACLVLAFGHLWSLPTALRAAAKLEGEAA
ncbi:hypothetical protein [Deinococcus murrayi]|uniref:hypothetical protein n=1 Tax=Deinococcus murrayi TaxID=68910 RepID=UPI0006855C4A|nr:hypothetical protein [Deinococcus murrayi]